jgi:4-diphosphocytidyl-2-C-methyl-D-erythritol kinase
VSTTSFTLPAFAKINWTLHVLGRRADGFHEIRTIFQTVSLCDLLTFEALAEDKFVLSCNEPSIPCDESNLVWRAARALRDRYRIKAGAAVRLEKRIPSEAGLGGGSSDAAVTLLGLSRLWRVETNREELTEIGARLGADVPFFLTGGTALGTGLGTEIKPLADIAAEHLLVVKPRAKVSTPEAYKALKRPALTKSTGDIILAISRAEALKRDSLPAGLHNDFEPVIFRLHGEIARASEMLMENGALGALLAGSGASVFAIFDNDERLARAQRVLDRVEGWRTFKCSALGRNEYTEALGECAAFLRS